jgi:hypothetical protein
MNDGDLQRGIKRKRFILLCRVLVTKAVGPSRKRCCIWSYLAKHRSIGSALRNPRHRQHWYRVQTSSDVWYETVMLGVGSEYRERGIVSDRGPSV